MKRKGKMSSALLLRLLVGLVIPFTACLLFIAMQTYTDVQEDKAQAYATLIEVVTQNMDATLGQLVYFKESWEQEKTVYCEPIALEGKNLLAISTPIYNRNGQKVGVLAGFVNLEYITNALKEVKITENSYIFMLNSDGMVSAHPDNNYVLQQNWVHAQDAASQETVASMSSTQKEAILLMSARESV